MTGGRRVDAGIQKRNGVRYCAKSQALNISLKKSFT